MYTHMYMYVHTCLHCMHIHITCTHTCTCTCTHAYTVCIYMYTLHVHAHIHTQAAAFAYTHNTQAGTCIMHSCVHVPALSCSTHSHKYLYTGRRILAHNAHTYIICSHMQTYTHLATLLHKNPFSSSVKCNVPLHSHFAYLCVTC